MEPAEEETDCPTGQNEPEPTPEEREAAREEYLRTGGLTMAEAIAFIRGG